MRIGILTFQQAINYGAILQAYALQRVILGLGVDVEIINYLSTKLSNDYKVLKTKKDLRIFLGSVFSVVAFTQKTRNFKNFSSKYLRLSVPIGKKGDVKEYSKRYDYVITGSDQVWNYKITNNDFVYLLDFVVPEKRLSYAASFGVTEIPECLRDNYSKLLSDFEYITVREKQGASLVKDLSGRDVPVVLDPTMLLSKSDWKAITDGVPVSSRKIVVYTMSRSDLLMSVADKLSKETGLEVAVLNPRLRSIYSKISTYSLGPDDFVGLFMNAEYILTNSFHGTAFAINFNKKFLVELPDGNRGKMNSRIENLLEMLNLEDRYISCLDLNKMYAEVDWEKVNKILDAERNKSLGHLKKMIEQNE